MYDKCFAGSLSGKRLLMKACLCILECCEFGQFTASWMAKSFTSHL